jgi:hypothetical protein
VNALTPQQESIFKVHADEYIDFFVNNRKYRPDLLTLDDVKDDIAFLYEFAGTASPPKYIFFADSDLQEKLMFNFIVNNGLNILIECMNKSEESIKEANKQPVKPTYFSTVLDKEPTITTISVETWLSVISSLVSQIRTNYPDTKEKIRSNTSLPQPNLEKNIQNDVNKELQSFKPMFDPPFWTLTWDKITDPIDNAIKRNITRVVNNDVNHTILSNREIVKLSKSDLKSLLSKEEEEDYASILTFTRFIRSFNTKYNLLYIPNSIGASSFDMSYYSFLLKTGLLNSPIFERYYNFIRKGVWSVQMYADWCIVTQMPSHISRDSQGRLHSLDGPPVEWRSRGKRTEEESYYIHGIKFDKELWEKTVSNSITIKEILKIQNMEQRQTVFSVISPQKFIDECDGKLISTHTQEKKGAEYMSKEAFDKIHHRPINLYKIENTGTLGLISPLYILLYTDPSTDRQYYMFVNPANSTDAATAMAASLGLTREQYINITAES